MVRRGDRFCGLLRRETLTQSTKSTTGASDSVLCVRLGSLTTFRLRTPRSLLRLRCSEGGGRGGGGSYSSLVARVQHCLVLLGLPPAPLSGRPAPHRDLPSSVVLTFPPPLRSPFGGGGGCLPTFNPQVWFPVPSRTGGRIVLPPQDRGPSRPTPCRRPGVLSQPLQPSHS